MPIAAAPPRLHPPRSTRGPTPGTGCTKFTDAPFAIDPAGPDTQVHAAGAFAAGIAYVVYDRPKGSDPSKLDVFLAAFRCDGKPQFAPVRVSDEAGNDVDPSVAVHGDRVVVAWASDSSAPQNNLSLHVRTFDLAGSAIGASRVYVGPRKGKDNVQNAWMTQVTASATGFDLVGAWGIDEAPAFQAFAARLDGQGSGVGEAIDLGFDATVTQSVPDVVAIPGAMVAAFQVEPNQGNGSHVDVVRVDDGGVAIQKIGTIDDALAPSLAANGSNVWVAASRGATATILWHVSDGSAKPVELTFGAAPTIALANRGGAIVATAIDATHRQLKLARFDDAGVLSNEIVIVPDVPPYALRLVTVDPAGLFFLAYQEGASPAFRAKGRFIDLR
ncbi:hypothetical protein BH09MYX1_BH09MYX1_57740 [soil metagenome]